MSSCILPNSLAQIIHEANKNQMKNLLRHIISLGILTPSFSDKVINQFSKSLATNTQLIETFSLVMINQINFWMIFTSKT